MKRKNPPGQFARLSYDMLDHIAFRTLTGADVRVLLELWRRCNGRNNGDLWLAARDGAERLGLNKDSVVGALAKLQGRGFIVRTSRGSRVKHIAPRWRLTMLPWNGSPPTNDWSRWMPGDDFSPSPEAAIEPALAEAAA